MAETIKNCLILTFVNDVVVEDVDVDDVVVEDVDVDDVDVGRCFH